MTDYRPPLSHSTRIPSIINPHLWHHLRSPDHQMHQDLAQDLDLDQNLTLDLELELVSTINTSTSTR